MSRDHTSKIAPCGCLIRRNVAISSPYGDTKGFLGGPEPASASRRSGWRLQPACSTASATRTGCIILRHLALGEHRVVDLTAHLGLAQSTVSQAPGLPQGLRPGRLRARRAGRRCSPSPTPRRCSTCWPPPSGCCGLTGDAVTLCPNYGIATLRGRPMTAHVHAAPPHRRTTRRRLGRRAQLLAGASVTYNVVEAVIAITAGVVAGSVALVGFGLDSVVEVSSGVDHPVAVPPPAARDPRTAGAAADGVVVLRARRLREPSSRCARCSATTSPDTSPVGIALAAASLVIMPFLSWAQRRTGKALGSNAVVADSTQTLLCTYLSAVLLVGLVLNATLGWSWADPIAGLVIAAVAVKEGREAWRGEGCCGPSQQPRPLRRTAGLPAARTTPATALTAAARPGTSPLGSAQHCNAARPHHPGAPDAHLTDAAGSTPQGARRHRVRPSPYRQSGRPSSRAIPGSVGCPRIPDFGLQRLRPCADHAPANNARSIISAAHWLSRVLTDRT